MQQRWSLTLGPPFDGDEVSCSWVAPVTLATGATAVLKLSMPHMEGEHEIEGLRFWSGDPTVRLLAGENDLGAMLLERCEPGTTLQPWLVIDPKPFVGDPAYDATQHLLNCCARLRSDPDRIIQRFADLLGVDHDRVRLWLFARAATAAHDWRNNSLLDVARSIAP